MQRGEGRVKKWLLRLSSIEIFYCINNDDDVS